MVLLKWELKKIWRPGLLLAIALIGLVFYDARPGFYLEYFWDSSDWWGVQAQLSSGWLEAYGTTMEPEERAQLDGQLAELEAQFAQQVAEIPGAAEAGITDYESYLDWDAAHQNGLTEEEHQLGFAVYSNTNLNMVESLMEFMENYDTLAEGEEPEIWGGRVGEYSPAHQPSIRRVEEVRAAGVFGFLPSAAINSADNFFHYFAIWCVFSAVLLLSPTLSGTGSAPPHQSHAVDLPPGPGCVERPDGSGPAVRGAAHPAQLRRLPGPFPGNRRPAVLGVLPDQCVER